MNSPLYIMRGAYRQVIPQIPVMLDGIPLKAIRSDCPTATSWMQPVFRL